MAMIAVTAKGRIMIPSKIRKKFNIKKGTKLSVEEDKDVIILMPITRAYIEKVASILHPKRKLTKTLLHLNRGDIYEKSQKI